MNEKIVLSFIKTVSVLCPDVPRRMKEMKNNTHETHDTNDEILNETVSFQSRLSFWELKLQPDTTP